MARIPAVVGLILLLVPLACAPSDGAREFRSIGTGGTGGIYYPLGGALAASLSAADPDRTWTAEVTGGSVENINRVVSGEIDLGFAIGMTVLAAAEGRDAWDTPVESLRVIAPLYPNVAHVLARQGLEAESLADARNTRVSVGSAGSGTEQFARQLLAAYDLDYETVDERYLSFTESSGALRDRAIDLAIFSVGYPASAVLEAMTSGNVSLLPVDGPPRDRLVSEQRVYRPAVIPGGTYPGLDGDLETVAMLNWLVGTETLDDEVVTTVLDTLRDRREALIRVNEIAARIDLASLADAPIPLHAAAARWLQEQDLP